MGLGKGEEEPRLASLLTEGALSAQVCRYRVEVQPRTERWAAACLLCRLEGLTASPGQRGGCSRDPGEAPLPGSGPGSGGPSAAGPGMLPVCASSGWGGFCSHMADVVPSAWCESSFCLIQGARGGQGPSRTGPERGLSALLCCRDRPGFARESQPRETRQPAPPPGSSGCTLSPRGRACATMGVPHRQAALSVPPRACGSIASGLSWWESLAFSSRGASLQLTLKPTMQPHVRPHV